MLKEALHVLEREADLPPDEVRWLWFASLIALYLWDDRAWTVVFTRQLELARRTGALSSLAFTLRTGTSVYAFFGELRTAALLGEEHRAASEATGIASDPIPRLVLDSLRGREDEFAEVSEPRSPVEGTPSTLRLAGG